MKRVEEGTAIEVDGAGEIASIQRRAEVRCRST
jgi:hypothetical protein